jgi:hypothetical protein
MISSAEGSESTSTRGIHGKEQAVSIAVSTAPSRGDSSGKGNAFDGSGMNPLEKRRQDLEFGEGGDHDIPYRFTSPSSVPQVLAWVKLLVRVQNGSFQP